MQALANKIDYDLLGLYTNIPNQVGTPGVTPSKFLTFAEAQATLADFSTPMQDRYCVVDPWCQAQMADAFKGLFAADKVKDAINSGSMGGMIAGFDMHMSQNVRTHTCGTAAGVSTLLADGATTDGDSTMDIDQNGSWAVTFKAGDIFTVANVNGVNPITGLATGRARQFVVTADVGTSGNEGTCSIIPGTDPWFLYDSSAAETYLPYQTIDTHVVDNAAVTCAGSASLAHKVNLAFHRDCMGLVMVPLEMPASATWKAQKSYKGYSMRVIRGYDIINDVEYIRFDVLYGKRVLNPLMGCRIAG
jgi:hypothetical protein